MTLAKNNNKLNNMFISKKIKISLKIDTIIIKYHSRYVILLTKSLSERVEIDKKQQKRVIRSLQNKILL